MELIQTLPDKTIFDSEDDMSEEKLLRALMAAQGQ